MLQKVRRSNIICQFIDFDKKNEIFYANLYFEEFKIVFKIPLLDLQSKYFDIDVKIDRFNLEKYTYLLAYD